MACLNSEPSLQCSSFCESNLASCIASCFEDPSCQSVCNREYTACSIACPCGQKCPRKKGFLSKITDLFHTNFQQSEKVVVRVKKLTHGVVVISLKTNFSTRHVKFWLKKVSIPALKLVLISMCFVTMPVLKFIRESKELLVSVLKKILTFLN